MQTAQKGNIVLEQSDDIQKITWVDFRDVHL